MIVDGDWMKILLVYNPAAGHGKAGRALPEIDRRFRNLGIEAKVRLSEHRGHATEIVEQASFEDFDGVIAGGGDGTVFEAVNGLLRNPAGAAIPFGVLPLGTGNSFSRDIGLEKKRTTEAIELIARAETRKVDVGLCRAGLHEFHFLNILGAGFVTDVTSAAARLKFLGNGAYTLGVLYRTTFLKSFNTRLELDGHSIDRDAIFVEISNSRYTADFLMAPEARIDDGFLDVTLLCKISRRRLLRLFPTVFRGEHIHYPEVETFRAQRITIATECPKTLSPDGELVGATPAEISCLHRAISVFG
jgi:diacylglycerol kinase (ATP)